MAHPPTAIVTGANAGIGFELTRALARDGWRVVMACRSAERADNALRLLLDERPDANLAVLPLDVSEPDSVAAFARQFGDDIGSLDLLVNNAGIVGVPETRNGAGWELHLATNYLGPFALTGLLLPHFAAGSAGRIVNVGSLAHRFAKLDLDNFNWERGGYGPMRAYARSKLALLTFTVELERRLRRRGAPVMALAAHPGFAATEIGKDNPMTNPSNPVGKWFNGKMESRIPTAAEAARPVLHAACAAGVRGGDYFGPGGWLEIGGAPARARLNRRVYDADMAQRLWQLSGTMTGVNYLDE